MANYNELPYNGVPLTRSAVGPQVYRATSRAYVAADTVRFWKIERDVKIVEALVGCSAAMGTTAVATLRLNNGTTQVNLITAASLTAADVITRLNVSAGLGYVVPSRGFWLELLFTTLTVGTAGVLIAGIVTSGAMIGAESPLHPTGTST